MTFVHHYISDIYQAAYTGTGIAITTAVIVYVHSAETLPTLHYMYYVYSKFR